MKKTDLAYYTGIIDGEGAIGICKHRDTDCRRGYRFQLSVQVTSLDEWLLQSLKIAFCGNITRSKYGFAKKTSWHWMIHCKQALEFLKAILPYLRLKRYQAEIAIKFQEAKRRGGWQTDQEYVLEEAQRILIHRQTRKGIKIDEPNL